MELDEHIQADKSVVEKNLTQGIVFVNFNFFDLKS